MTARCIGVFSKIAMLETMNSFLERVLPWLAAIDDCTKQEGAIEALACILYSSVSQSVGGPRATPSGLRGDVTNHFKFQYLISFLNSQNLKNSVYCIFPNASVKLAPDCYLTLFWGLFSVRSGQVVHECFMG